MSNSLSRGPAASVGAMPSPGGAPTLTTPTPTGQGVAQGSLHCPVGGESVVTLRFDQNHPGPLVPGDTGQLGGAEVVCSCLWGLGRGGGWSQTSPSCWAIRAECPSHACGAVLLSLCSADPGSGVSGVHRPRRRGRQGRGVRERPVRVKVFLHSAGRSRCLCT